MEQQSGPWVRYNTTKQPQACMEAWLPLVTALSVSPENPEPEHQLRGISQGRTPIPSLNCYLPAMGTHIIDTQSAPAFTGSFELVSELHWKNKTHLFKELIHEAVPVHTNSDFIIIITVLRLQQDRKKYQQVLPANLADPFQEIILGESSSSPCSLAPMSWDKHQ